jgi:hypothetical protein
LHFGVPARHGPGNAWAQPRKRNVHGTALRFVSPTQLVAAVMDCGQD